jgi:ribosome-associated translation inhibitor RaiA
MKETLLIIKQAYTTLFAVLFGCSIFFNIKQYYKIEKKIEYIKDIENVLYINNKATGKLLNVFDQSVTIMLKDSIIVPKKFKSDTYKALNDVLKSNLTIKKFAKKYNY